MADPLNPSINVNPSPKQRFIAVSAYIGAHRDLMQRPELQRGVDHALMQLIWEESQNTLDGNSAAAAAYKMTGAQRFISILRELAESPRIPQRKPGEKEMTV